MLQVVKQRMQTGQFASAPNAVRLIVANEGFKGLYAVCTYYVIFPMHFIVTAFILNM